MNLTEEQYNYICSSCDSLLLHSKNSTRIANDWLHVIRPHPIYFKKFQHLFNTNNILNTLIYILKNLSIYLAKIFIRLLKSINNKRTKITVNFNNVESVYVSHLLNIDQLNNLDDFYFHQIPNKFSGNDKSLVLLINHTNEKIHYDKIFFKNKIVIPNTLSFFEEVKISKRLIIDAFKLIFSKGDLKIKLTAAVESLSPSSHKNLRFGLFVKKIIKTLNPDFLFTTYEGQPWERVVYGMATSVSKKIKKIGYQHALFFKNQHSISRKLSKTFNPDYILCSGEKSYLKFLNLNFIDKSKILLIGSNRLSLSEYIENKELKTFLVLPEGDLLECLPLVDLAISLAEIFKDINFIIRLHPITNRSNLLKLRPKLDKFYNNLELSSISFDKDVERCNAAIYRGSSSIIKAIQKGLIPIYYDIINQPNIDPIYNLNNFKTKIINPNDFSNILSSESNILHNQKKLIENVRSYFTEFNYKELTKITS